MLVRLDSIPGVAEARADSSGRFFRVELFATFERVHREGGRPSSGWIHEAWPRIAQTALTPCAASLPPGVAADLAACPPSLLD